MGEQFFIIVKKDLHHLLKRLVIIMAVWMIISVVLINVLFSYFKYYVHKETAKVFYEVKYSVSEIQDTPYKTDQSLIKYRL